MLVSGFREFVVWKFRVLLIAPCSQPTGFFGFRPEHSGYSFGLYPKHLVIGFLVLCKKYFQFVYSWHRENMHDRY